MTRLKSRVQTHWSGSDCASGGLDGATFSGVVVGADGYSGCDEGQILREACQLAVFEFGIGLIPVVVNLHGCGSEKQSNTCRACPRSDAEAKTQTRSDQENAGGLDGEFRAFHAFPRGVNLQVLEFAKVMDAV